MVSGWVGVAAFVGAGGLTEAVRRLAVRFTLVDRPSAHKFHERPTPHLGGIAIAASTLLPTLVAVGTADMRLYAVVLAATAVAILGLIDDLRPLSPATRLVVEGVAAAAVVVGDRRISIFGNWLDDLLCVLWIVVLTNSFNLIDNTDGTVAGIACVTGAALSLAAFTVGQKSTGVLLLALSCGCAGFLPHNWQPARIFMGDVGSLFIGFVVSTSALQVYGAYGHHAVLVGPLMVTFVAGLDTCVIFVYRRRAGLPFTAANPDHISDRLRQLGFGTWEVSCLLSGATAVTCLAGLAVARSASPVFVSLPIVLGSGAILVWLLLKVPVGGGAAPAAENGVPDGGGSHHDGVHAEPGEAEVRANQDALRTPVR